MTQDAASTANEANDFDTRAATWDDNPTKIACARAVADAMRAQRFRRERPNASEDEIEALMEAWRGERPGAEAGDSAGRSVQWPRRR